MNFTVSCRNGCTTRIIKSKASVHPDRREADAAVGESETPTCVDAGVLLHAPLAHERLLAVFTLELLGDVVQRSVHLQTVFVGERLAADLAGVRPHARVVEHVDPQGVQLRQGLPADVAHEFSLGERRRSLVFEVAVDLPLRALL